MLRTTAQPKLSSRTRTDIPTVVDGQKYPTTLPPMTDHLITPPPELIRKWNDEAATAPMADQRYIAIQAAHWGADQELEACCHLLRQQGFDVVEDLCAARRSKPPSLKEQALETLRQMHIDPETGVSPTALDTIRRALEQLDDH